MILVLRALGLGIVCAGAVLLPALLALLSGDILKIALAAGGAAFLAALLAQIVIEMPPLRLPGAGPLAFQRALAKALPVVEEMCQGQAAFEASWRWDEQGLTPLDRNDHGIASATTPRSGHARLAEAEALQRALAPAAPLLRTARRAAGAPLVLRISWEPERTYLGQRRPAAAQISIGPETFPWRDRAWGGHYNLVASSDQIRS